MAQRLAKVGQQVEGRTEERCKGGAGQRQRQRHRGAMCRCKTQGISTHCVAGLGVEGGGRVDLDIMTATYVLHEQLSVLSLAYVALSSAGSILLVCIRWTSYR